MNIAGLALGVYEFELMVRDHVGYRTDDAINVTIQDTIAPEWIAAPSDQNLLFGEFLHLQLSAEDASGIGGWSVDDTTNFTISPIGLITNNTVLEVGDYSLTVYVEDTIGNVREFTLTVHVISSTPPGPGDLVTLVIIAAAAGVVIIIVVLFLMKKKKT